MGEKRSVNRPGSDFVCAENVSVPTYVKLVLIHYNQLHQAVMLLCLDALICRTSVSWTCPRTSVVAFQTFSDSTQHSFDLAWERFSDLFIRVCTTSNGRSPLLCSICIQFCWVGCFQSSLSKLQCGRKLQRQQRWRIGAALQSRGVLPVIRFIYNRGRPACWVNAYITTSASALVFVLACFLLFF